MSGNLKENVTRGSIWLRLVWMIVLGFAFNVAQVVTVAIVVFQFLSSLFTGKVNTNLTRFSGHLAHYFQQIVMFMTFVTEEKPFPFSAWTDAKEETTKVQASSNQPADVSGKNDVVASANKPVKTTKKPATSRAPKPTKAPPRPNTRKSAK